MSNPVFNNFDDVKIVYENLSEMEADLNRLEDAAKAAVAKSAEDLKDEYKHFIGIVDAVDSGFFQNTVSAKAVLSGKEAFNFVVESQSEISLIVEEGRKDANYPGRHPLERAFNELEARAFVYGNFDDFFDRALKRAK